MKHLTFIISLFITIGCGELAQPECRGAVDCGPEYCIAGSCNATPEQSVGRQSDEKSNESENVDTEQTLTPLVPNATPSKDEPKNDTEPVEPADPSHPCTSRKAPRLGDLVINEVLADVPPAPAGDANQDGIRDAYEDEFVELVNTTTGALELEGVQIWVGERAKFWFEPLCLLPGDGIVVFGGGSPNMDPDINVISSETRLGLSNSGNVIGLRTADGTAIHAIEYAGTSGSWVLWPEISGTEVKPHTETSDALFSPGRCVDGAPLTTGCGS